MPNVIEDDIINIKDNLINFGLKDGIKKTIDDTIEIGKSAIGLFTNNFESISQAQGAIKTGGLIDKISLVLDYAVDFAKKAGVLNNGVANVLKNGKDTILNNVEKNIEKTFSNQIENSENLEKNIKRWEDAYNNKNFEDMEKNLKKIEKNIKELMPIENIIKKAREIENLHNLIKNKDGDFNLSEEEINLCKNI